MSVHTFGNRRKHKAAPSDSPEVANRQVHAIAAALKENEGLVELNLSYCFSSDETWNATCDSLKTHPTLEVLDLSSAIIAGMTSAVIAYRIQSLLDMMKVNMSIHTITHTSFCESRSFLFSR
jgi:hypothetical protein